ncbi:MAG: hypothetical protein ACE5G0_01305 [Rhodothermales bacterium]
MKKTAIFQQKRPQSSRWFNKWVQSPRWFLGFWIVVGLCLLIYGLNVLIGPVHPENAWSLGYGTTAALVLVSVFGYALRRRAVRLRPGRSWYYLQVHVYGGSLFLLLVFMHVGFKVPHGILAWWLWFFSIWVVASGLLGVVLQKWIPTLLNSGLSVEVHYDRIPELIEGIRARADELARSCDYPIRAFYRKNLAPALALPETRLIYYLDVTGGIQARIRQFDYLRALLPAAEQEKLDALRAIYKTKLEIDAHYTLQKALRWWLYLHVPVSILLIALLGLHLFAVLYY